MSTYTIQSKEVYETRRAKVMALQHILAGYSPSGAQERRFCALQDKLQKLTQDIRTFPVRSPEAGALLFAIRQSLCAMSANIITSKALKSERDQERTLSEMEKRVAFFDEVLHPYKELPQW